MKKLKFSYSCRCASVAMVSKTMDDFPEPETPVKMVIWRLGMRSDTSFRLFSRAPRISMNSLTFHLSGGDREPVPGRWGPGSYQPKRGRARVGVRAEWWGGTGVCVLGASVARRQVGLSPETECYQAAHRNCHPEGGAAP